MAGQGMRTRWLAGAARVVGFAAAPGPGAPANATTPLSIHLLLCIPQGDDLVECDVAAAGGVAPYGYVWANAPEQSDDVIFGCSSQFGAMNVATVAATDSAGSHVTKSIPFTCNDGPRL
ncbi:MAG TPA: hypothetical protein VFX16_27195 [Pseudonocardiaceae bacterium]|nr:hypothetical protein [Pseudonocardiaceae bacterium]